MKASIVITLLAVGLVPVFPVGLDNKRKSFIGWLYDHTIFNPANFDMVPEEDYLTAFEDAYDRRRR